jgi:hypothetical protein
MAGCVRGSVACSLLLRARATLARESDATRDAFDRAWTRARRASPAQHAVDAPRRAARHRRAGAIYTPVALRRTSGQTPQPSGEFQDDEDGAHRRVTAKGKDKEGKDKGEEEAVDAGEEGRRTRAGAEGS